MVNRILGINNGVITINNRILDILMKTGKRLDFLNIDRSRIPKFWTSVTAGKNAVLSGINRCKNWI